jgi:hypothetical protein
VLQSARATLLDPLAAAWAGSPTSPTVTARAPTPMAHRTHPIRVHPLLPMVVLPLLVLMGRADPAQR